MITLGHPEQDLLNNIIKNIEKEQNDEFLLKKKFKQIKNRLEQFFTYYVHEYVRPDNSCGYQILIEIEQDGKTYAKSIGYGEEAESRTSDWQEITNEL